MSISQTTLFSRHRAFIFQKMVVSYNHAYSIKVSYFEICGLEADFLFLVGRGFHWVALDRFTSLLTSANSFMVLSFTYTEMQVSPFHFVSFNSLGSATYFIPSFRQSLPSFYFPPSFFSPSFPLFAISNPITVMARDIKYSMLTSSAMLFDTAAFNAKLISLELPVKSF